ncbi:ornithine carbamoyltransferase [Halorubellus sp. JP-L1]|uniref:ornithine carbamoyltransferase n=1 Tax=Halorubellus sp. JP-L1 TaxID=2715753 RepID=UPI00140C4FE3|nr:ornithine carbamoyltransferase [Halorubellus sp. JP-L1]NHN43337.1 ornithine carbamoyltransferase [Halorubellus sp. JP-L1]
MSTPTADPSTASSPEPPAHVLDVDDLSVETFHAVLADAADYQQSLAAGTPHRDLPEHTLGMLFEKPSTRTRMSFETGMTQLGGHAVFLGPDATHLGHGEPLKDTARALSGYADALAIRTFDHDAIETIAAYADVPVVNALTDDAHPCQALADLLTIQQAFDDDFEDASVAWVGDGNNVAASFAIACAMAGVDCTIATPEGHGLDQDVLDRAAAVGPAPTVTHDFEAAVADVDVIETDVWVSMGEDDDKREAFDGWTVTADVLEAADAKFMHCLPANRGEEVTDAAIESERSLVWQQAENRLHVQKALLVELLS